jgi:hypothetical protein
VPDRPSARTVGGLSVGLVLGAVLGWVAGLLRVRRLPEDPR